MSFLFAVAHVLDEEGGYANHAADPGGATNRGITQRTLDRARVDHPDLRLPSAVRELTLDQTREIYRRDYWLAVRADEVHDGGLALLLFDAAVNHGVSGAVRMMQRVLGVADDGRFGPVTLAALRNRPAAATAIDYMTARMHLYVRQPGWATFGQGWTRRAFRTFGAAARLGGW